MKKDKVCIGCLICSPEDYTIEVDGLFLKIVQGAFKSLKEQAPDYFAEGWQKYLDDYIKKIEKKYKQKIDLF